MKWVKVNALPNSFWSKVSKTSHALDRQCLYLPAKAKLYISGSCGASYGLILLSIQTANQSRNFPKRPPPPPLFLAWAWLAKAKGHSCHTKKINSCQNIYGKKTSKSAKHACRYATKNRPVKITMYLGLDIRIKLKFTTILYRCAILNVLNYLTKKFES